MMSTFKTIADFDFVTNETIDFDLDRPNPPEHLIYHLTRQRRKPHMEIQAVDRLGFCAALVTEGQAVFEHLGKTFPLRTGSVFLRRPELPYRFYKNDPDEIGLIMIMFDLSARPLWEQCVEADCIGLHPPNSTQIIQLSESYFDLLKQNPERRIERANAFAVLFLETLLAEHIQHAERRDPAREQAERCRRYLHDHAASLQNITEAARACHISRGRFHELFRLNFQTTPKDYLDRIRIRTAADLLTQTNWTIDRIAAAVGFVDAPTFSKAFKRRNSIAPLHWRNNSVTSALNKKKPYPVEK